MYSLGYDIGSSSIKIAIVNHHTGKSIALTQEPDSEMGMKSLHPGWAEQDPLMWWSHICNGTKRILSENNIAPDQIISIGISYQMHGLVIIDQQGNLLRDAIIWCDSRAVEIGNAAYANIGEEWCNQNLLNAPGNFTASKLRWVKENEPHIFEKIQAVLLPGDYIAYKMSGEISTTANGLSEGIFWDFNQSALADKLLDYYEFPQNIFPPIVENFTNQVFLNSRAAMELGLKSGIPIRYRAGDQPNNALSLNVLSPGEFASTGGTSGVIYAVTDQPVGTERERINHFVHVNHSSQSTRLGQLLCINGAGIMYRWMKDNFNIPSYKQADQLAAAAPPGSMGLTTFPFGNGAERMLNNRMTGARITGLDLNRHDSRHLLRSGLEGIAFAFVYGMQWLKNEQNPVKSFRAGNDNLFRSSLFSETIATLIGQPIDVFNTTGAIGAARACLLQPGHFTPLNEMVMEHDHIKTYHPLTHSTPYQEAYANWKHNLEKLLQTI